MLEISVYVHQDIRSMLIAALKRREEKALFPLLTPTVLGWLGWALTTGKKGKEEESRANPRRTKKEEALIPTTPLTLLPGCFLGGGGESPTALNRTAWLRIWCGIQQF